MHCGECGLAAREGASFCLGCGAELHLTCARCARALPTDARFCDGCGTAVVAAEPSVPVPVGARKVVTILFADLAGSTRMQERLDAETTARVMDRVQRLLGAAVDQHGGRVVKSMGDGLMAVFGVPVAREDDALRAVRAGVAMQSSFAELAAELDRTSGIDVGLRVGLNTGEVVVEPDTDDVVGDPVNLAARLESAAALGEVLVGPETQRLIRDDVEIELVAPLVLKGKSEPVGAARVVAVDVTGARTTRFVGRESDLASIVDAFHDAVEAAATRLVTVVGFPGLGKSRLAEAVVQSIGDQATVVEVRFVADAGTSFGPIAAALRSVVDVADVDLGDDAERVSGVVAALLGGGAPGSTEQVLWALRRLLEAMATQRPVLVVLDDVHWAEPAMLDLIEHLAEWLRAPVLLLALARPELRERRSSMLEIGGPSDAVVPLGGLDAETCRRLALDVLDADALPERVLARVLAASEGNPLFLRELLRLLVDDGVLVPGDGRRWSLTVDVDAIELPPTIHAALAARIDQLSTEEREVLQAAAVIGRHFARGAVAALVPPQVATRVDEQLRNLHRRALVDPEGTFWDDEPLFRFHHVLIRDAAYRRVLKEVRADLHARYATWLSARAGAGEHDEVLGLHLEQSHLYRVELGLPADPTTAVRAAGHLAAAGRRALEADDLANAASLLGRAHALTPDDVDLLRDHCEAVVSAGDVAAAEPVVAAFAAVARDDAAVALADVFDAQLVGQRNAERLREVAGRAAAAAEVLAAVGDDVGVAKAESVHASARAGLGEIAACESALDRALAAARRAGDRRRANTVLAIAPAAALWGPSPVARASGRCLDVVRVLRITSWAPHVEAQALRCQAVLEAMRDRPEAARRMVADARTRFEELGHRLGILETRMHEGIVELLAGDAAAAEEPLREAVEGFDALGGRVASARATALLARALLELGRVEEAEAIADPALAGDDLKASIGLLGVRAEILAARADVAEAELLARRAVSLAEATDALVDHADARLALARVLDAAGRGGDADAERQRARELYEAKGATTGTARCGPTAAGAPPSAPPALTRRPPVPNLATATAAQRTAASSGGRGSIEPVSAPGLVAELEVLVTFGERHALLRSSGPSDGGGGTAVSLQVRRADRQGRLLRHDSFAGDDLPAALGCLLERWAEDELDGPAHERAMRMADGQRSTIALNERDWARYADAFTTDSVLVDHRGNGLEVSGRAAVVDWIRQLVASGDDVQVRVTDVLALTSDAGIWVSETSGIASGGAFAVPTLIVFHIAADGRFDRREFFRPDQLDDAWACFDRFAGVARRRVVPNAATAVLDRWADRHDAGDHDALADLYDGEFVAYNHALQAHVPLGEHLRLLRHLASVRVEVLATLGRRHALHRVLRRWRLEGAEGELVVHYVTRVSAEGKLVRQDAFDDLADALACLADRWGEGEGGGGRADGIAAYCRLVHAVQARDWIAVGDVFAVDAVLDDRRPASAGSCRGRADVVAYLRALRDQAEAVSYRVDDVLALSPTAALMTTSIVGTAQGTGFEWRSLLLARFSPDGRVLRAELFAADDEDVAWRRFDELGAEPAVGADGTPRRDLRPNAASALSQAWAEAFNAGDLEASNALRSARYERRDHHWHHRVSRESAVALDSVTSVDGRAQIEPIATLGTRVALGHLHFVVDDAVTERWVLTVASADGTQIERDELFGPDQLDEAIGRLQEQWAELDRPHGPDAAALRWARAIRGFRMAVRAEWDVFRSLFDDGVVLHDHRLTGAGEVRTAGAVVEVLRSAVDSMSDGDILVTDVVLVTPTRLVVELLQRGTADGVLFDDRLLADIRCGSTGAVASLELWPHTQRDQLLAPVATPAAERRVRPNLATSAAAAYDAALAAGSEDVLALFDPSFESTEHRFEIVDLDRDLHGELADDGMRATTEVLASLGERHVLVRTVVETSDAEDGPSEWAAIFVTRVTGEGRFVHFDRFSSEDLDLALACLVERWAEDEAEPLERARARNLAGWWSYARLVRARDWDAYGQLAADDAVFVDHRPTGVGEITGREAIVAWIRELSDATDGVDARVEDVLALTTRAALIRNLATGTAAGGDWSMPSYVVVAFGPDGRLARIEFFPLDRLDDAWRSYDRCDETPRARAANRATTTLARSLVAASEAGVDAVRSLYAPGYRVERHDHHLEIDLAAYRSEQAWLVAHTDVDVDVVVTMGERHCLYRFAYTWSGDGDRGEASVEQLIVCRVDGGGRFALEDAFRADDLGAAVACLVERWADDELDDGGRAPIARCRLWSFPELLESCDWDAVGDLFAADGTFIDRRPASFGEVRGRAAIVDWLRAYRESVDSEHLELVDVLALSPSAALLVYRAWGEAAGSSWETAPVVLAAFDDDGRLTHHEDWSPEQLDGAWAAWDRLHAGVAVARER